VAARWAGWPIVVLCAGAGVMLCGGAAGCRKAERAPAAGSAGSAAAVDAATPPADAAPDAPPAPKAIIIGDTVPELGCIGWSPKRGLVACILGQRGYNLGGSKVDLVFFGVGKVAGDPSQVPESIAILDTGDEGGAGLDALDPALTARLRKALEGFLLWDRSGPILTAETVDGKPTASPPLTTGGMTIALRAERAPQQGYAPCLSAQLTVRVPGGARHIVNEVSGPISVEVRAFPLDGVGRGTVIVEHLRSTGDEGISGTEASVWRCTAAGCATP
jgi:hypothetical protein